MNEKKRQRKEWSVLAVQTAVGGILLLLVLLLRFVGGEVYDNVRIWFQTTVTEDTFLKAEADGQGGEFLPPDTALVVAVPLPSTVKPHPLLYGGNRTSDFGYRTDPLRGGAAFHTGVDIAAPRGTPLYAVCDATVLQAGKDDSYGNYLVLSVESGVQLWYAHCDSVCVEIGQIVNAGETVATVGSTGDSTGPHVHFMLKRDGIVYDPSVWIANECYA